MKRQLLVVVALAVLTTAIVAASALAGTIKIGIGSQDISINLPGGADLEPLGGLPACVNLKDDDGDGRVDLLDPGCSGPGDTDETDPTPPGGGSGGGGTPGTPGTNPGGGGSGGSGGAGGTGHPGPGSDGAGQAAVGGTGGGGRGHGEQKPPRDAGDKDVQGNRQPMSERADREPDGAPTATNPTVTISDFGPAPVGVPNFVIDSFSIPPFLLPIYQSCGTEYGIPWEVLASINRIETAFGTNLNVSTAGALGWMQFIPSSWKAYGVDANSDGKKDPYNPVDAICAAARYLKAAGGDKDISRAIFAYNHADWYVDEVLLYAKQYGHIPDDVIGSLTGLTEGARFPVAAKSRYADDISERQAAKRAKTNRRSAGNAADVISSSPTRRGINIFSRKGAPVIAVNDGVIKRLGRSKKLGRYAVLEDAYGNRFTYAQLGSLARRYPVPKRKQLSPRDFKIVDQHGDAVPGKAASRSSNQAAATARKSAHQGGSGKSAVAASGPVDTEDSRDRLFALPQRTNNLDQADLNGQLDSALGDRFPSYKSFKPYLAGVLRYNPKTMELAKLRKGAKVIAGTVLGRIGGPTDVKGGKLASHLNFAIRPAGRGAPQIDPKPILDGWKLLEATAIYRASGANPFAGSGASVGQILLASKDQLQRRVLADPRLDIYACGRDDIASGQIDRRVLALLEYLAERGYRLTITSLRCGHSLLTTSGNVSEHTTGTAVDIAQINGIPVLGNQGPGTITEALVRDTLALQGTMEPHQVISLMRFGGPSFAMADHDDHVHVGYRPVAGSTPSGSNQRQFTQILKPAQWQRLIGRIADIENPRVARNASDASLPAGKAAKRTGKRGHGRASSAHLGE